MLANAAFRAAKPAKEEGQMEEQSKNMKSVYTVVDRGQGKSIWVRVGVGFTNRDGSLNLRLDAIPVNGSLQVREWEPYDRNDRRADAADGQVRSRPKAHDGSTDSLL
jgi:hypothetical protein